MAVVVLLPGATVPLIAQTGNRLNSKKAAGAALMQTAQKDLRKCEESAIRFGDQLCACPVADRAAKRLSGPYRT